jgi:hypothetical protein
VVTMQNWIEVEIINFSLTTNIVSLNKRTTNVPLINQPQ